ncbi:MAG: OmpA family protein [Pirellulales bacterium]|nr:OmpA family protein [Pirellulales bacterium]
MLVFSRRLSWTLCAVPLVLWGGCMVPQSQMAAVRVQNQNLAEQNRVQLAEINNLRIHCRNTEDQLRDAEEKFSLLQQRLGLDDQKLANYEAERDSLRKQCVEAVNGEPWLSPELQGRLARFSKDHPELTFDPATGIAKLDTDILFDSGRAELKPGAEELLRKLTKLLDQPDSQDLRVMVVGHTDDRRIVRAPGGDAYASNFDLSSARALAVANRLRGQGVESDRIGVAGFGAHQPVVPNASARDRYKNRRVEIFVMAPNVPIVGWTETTPAVYR